MAMPKFLEDYVTVQELITKMNEIYPNGSLISDIVDIGEDFVVFKTTFFENKEDEAPKATGFARQQKGDHNSWFEMGETKSRGRCLRIVFSEDTVAEEMIGIAPSKHDKQGSEANVSVIEGKSEEKSSDILGDAAKKLENDKPKVTREHIVKAYANTIKNKAMELVGDDTASAKELYERALQEVGILEDELDHNNSLMVRNELENQLESLNR
jgi:hypothetical protein